LEQVTERAAVLAFGCSGEADGACVRVLSMQLAPVVAGIMLRLV
jgi:hypothetical protein